MFAFMVAADPSKWEYTICQLLAGLWSPDTICTEEKGNPVISCVKSDSPNGANCTPRRYLIGRKTSCISGSMAPFILPGLLCSGECLLLSGCFVMTVILVFLFLVAFRKLFSSGWVWSKCSRVWETCWDFCRTAFSPDRQDLLFFSPRQLHA